MDWIPVEEKLPEKDGWYIISLGDAWTEDGFGAVTGKRKSYDSDVRMAKYTNGHFSVGMVAAWMEKPKPYTGEKK